MVVRSWGGTELNATTLANCTMVSTVYAGIALGIVHLSNRQYDIISQPMSYYAVGMSNFLMTTVILAFAASTLALSFAFDHVPGLSRLGIAALKMAGASLAVAAIFPSDVTDKGLPETLTGFIHTVASYFFSPGLVAAALLLSRRFDDTQLRHVPAFVLALASWTSFIILTLINLLDLRFGGIGQRIFVGLTWLWLMMNALRLKRTLRRG